MPPPLRQVVLRSRRGLDAMGGWVVAVLVVVLVTLLGEQPGPGRLIPVGFTAVAAVAFWALARSLVPLPAARWALVAFALSPILRWGGAVTPAAAASAFALLALLAFRMWLDVHSPLRLWAAAAALSAAAVVEPTALVTGLVIAVWLLIGHRGDRMRQPSLYVAAVASLVPPALWPAYTASLHRGALWGGVAPGTGPQSFLVTVRTEALLVHGVIGLPLAAAGLVWLYRHRRRYLTAVVFVLSGAVGLGVAFVVAGGRPVADLGRPSPVFSLALFSLPFAALAVGLGTAACLRQVRRRLPAGRRTAMVLLTVTVVGLLATQSAWAR